MPWAGALQANSPRRHSYALGGRPGVAPGPQANRGTGASYAVLPWAVHGICLRRVYLSGGVPCLGRAKESQAGPRRQGVVGGRGGTEYACAAVGPGPSAARRYLLAVGPRPRALISPPGGIPSVVARGAPRRLGPLGDITNLLTRAAGLGGGPTMPAGRCAICLLASRGAGGIAAPGASAICLRRPMPQAPPRRYASGSLTAGPAEGPAPPLRRPCYWGGAGHACSGVARSAGEDMKKLIQQGMLKANAGHAWAWRDAC